MNRKIGELIEAIRTLEEELQEEFRRKREEFRFTIEARRVRFAEDLILQHRQLKVGLLRYLREARLRSTRRAAGASEATLKSPRPLTAHGRPAYDWPYRPSAHSPRFLGGYRDTTQLDRNRFFHYCDRCDRGLR